MFLCEFTKMLQNALFSQNNFRWLLFILCIRWSHKYWCYNRRTQLLKESLHCEILAWLFQRIRSFGKRGLQLFQITEAAETMCLVKKMFLNILQNSQENTCARVSFLKRFQASACNFIKKETLVQVFSSEFWKITKNTFFCRTYLVPASETNPWNFVFIIVRKVNFFYK